MDITINFNTDNAAFENDIDGALAFIYRQLPVKIARVLSRAPGCICTHPESDDKLFDVNGNAIGSITISE